MGPVQLRDLLLRVPHTLLQRLQLMLIRLELLLARPPVCAENQHFPVSSRGPDFGRWRKAAARCDLEGPELRLVRKGCCYWSQHAPEALLLLLQVPGLAAAPSFGSLLLQAPAYSPSPGGLCW